MTRILRLAVTGLVAITLFSPTIAETTKDAYRAPDTALSERTLAPMLRALGSDELCVSWQGRKLCVADAGGKVVGRASLPSGAAPMSLCFADKDTGTCPQPGEFSVWLACVGIEDCFDLALECEGRGTWECKPSQSCLGDEFPCIACLCTFSQG